MWIEPVRSKCNPCWQYNELLSLMFLILGDKNSLSVKSVTGICSFWAYQTFTFKYTNLPTNSIIQISSVNTFGVKVINLYANNFDLSLRIFQIFIVKNYLNNWYILCYTLWIWSISINLCFGCMVNLVLHSSLMLILAIQIWKF